MNNCYKCRHFIKGERYTHDGMCMLNFPAKAVRGTYICKDWLMVRIPSLDERLGTLRYRLKKLQEKLADIILFNKRRVDEQKHYIMVATEDIKTLEKRKATKCKE